MSQMKSMKSGRGSSIKEMLPRRYLHLHLVPVPQTITRLHRVPVLQSSTQSIRCISSIPSSPMLVMLGDGGRQQQHLIESFRSPTRICCFISHRNNVHSSSKTLFSNAYDKHTVDDDELTEKNFHVLADDILETIQDHLDVLEEHLEEYESVLSVSVLLYLFFSRLLSFIVSLPSLLFNQNLHSPLPFSSFFYFSKGSST